MARPFVLGNGEISIGIDQHGYVRDFYFPYVGQENHVHGLEHRIGIWSNGSFSWFSSPKWTKKLSYKKETLVTDIQGINKEVGLELSLHDTICQDKNIFIRKSIITNITDEKKSIRLFFHQKFDIFESNIGDTVFFNPFIHALIHYKGKRYFLMNGLYEIEGEKHGIDNYATGLAGEFGREGTYIDAQNGILSNNPIEHGSVDSTLAFHFELNPQQSRVAYYWVCVGQDLGEVSKLNGYIYAQSPENLLEETHNYWKSWVNRTPFEFHKLNNAIIDLFKQSLLIISTHIDKRGAIIASGDSDVLYLKRDTYSYMWPRDGALIVRALDRAGYFSVSEKFFSFCAQVLTPFGYLFHKYRPDGSFGSSWHSWIEEGNTQLPIQEDQIGLVLDALWKHYSKHEQTEHAKKIFPTFIRKIENFLLSFFDADLGLPKESYDLWEEKLGIHTFTCCAVYAGIRAAANFEQELGTQEQADICNAVADKIQQQIIERLYDPQLGRFIKGLYYHKGKVHKDLTHDASSFYGVFQFRVLDINDDRVTSGYEKCKQELISKFSIGGLARYEGDQYHRLECSDPGNPWFITTLWLAEYHITRAKNFEELKPAIEILEWCTKYTLPTGILPEQLDPCSGLPLSVAPLTWSHAAFVIAVIKYLEKLDELGICKICNPTTM